MIIKGFLENSLIDWEGKITAVIFTGGCNFRCPFCHNHELVRDGGSALKDISEAKLFTYLKENAGWIDGIVVSGGEPCINADLPDFLARLKHFAFRIKLDTNGSNPDMLGRVMGMKLVDYVAMDLKAPLRPEKYSALTGGFAGTDAVRKSMELLRAAGIDYEFRTTFVPGLLTKEDIMELSLDIMPEEKYYLQQFKNENTFDAGLKETEPYPLSYLVDTIKQCGERLAECRLR